MWIHHLFLSWKIQSYMEKNKITSNFDTPLNKKTDNIERIENGITTINNCENFDVLPEYN